MEIDYCYSIQVHVLTREMICVGMHLLKYFGLSLVDTLITLAGKFKYGDLSKYGIHRPNKGPFLLKATTGRSSVIDVGTVAKIQSGEIKVSFLSFNVHNIYPKKKTS